METFTKKDENTILFQEVKPEVIIPSETLPEKEYDYNFLLKQKDDIQKQWDEQIEQKNKEIVEINERQGKEKAFVEKLIAEADKLGIVAKKIEAIPVEISPVEIINPIK